MKKLWIDNKDVLRMSEYFPEPKSSGGRVKIQLHSSNYLIIQISMQQLLIHQTLLKKNYLS